MTDLAEILNAIKTAADDSLRSLHFVNSAVFDPPDAVARCEAQARECGSSVAVQSYVACVGNDGLMSDLLANHRVVVLYGTDKEITDDPLVRVLTMPAEQMSLVDECRMWAVATLKPMQPPTKALIAKYERAFLGAKVVVLRPFAIAALGGGVNVARKFKHLATVWTDDGIMPCTNKGSKRVVLALSPLARNAMKRAGVLPVEAMCL